MGESDDDVIELAKRALRGRWHPRLAGPPRVGSVVRPSRPRVVGRDHGGCLRGDELGEGIRRLFFFGALRERLRPRGAFPFNVVGALDGLGAVGCVARTAASISMAASAVSGKRSMGSIHSSESDRIRSHGAKGAVGSGALRNRLKCGHELLGNTRPATRAAAARKPHASLESPRGLAARKPPAAASKPPGRRPQAREVPLGSPVLAGPRSLRPSAGALLPLASPGRRLKAPQVPLGSPGLAFAGGRSEAPYPAA